MTFGFYRVIEANKERRLLSLFLSCMNVFQRLRALKEEKLAARRSLIPILQAEEDARFLSPFQKDEESISFLQIHQSPCSISGV